MTFSALLLSTSLLGAVILLGARLWNQYKFQKKFKMPPGPRGIPIFGNLFQMPASHQGPWAKKMADKYGEMFTIKLADNYWVIINSTRVINDLLEKRSAIYSSRPRLPYVSELMSGSLRMVLQGYGPQWRSLRKIMHSILNVNNMPTFAKFQELESTQLVYDLMKKPEEWHFGVQRFTNSVIMSVVFGKRVLQKEENTNELLDTIVSFMDAGQPGAHLVDSFHSLDKLPKFMKWWTVQGEESYQKVLKVYSTEVEDLKRRRAEGTCPPCFATAFLDNPETEKLGEKQTLFALGTAMEAGTDTSRIMTTNFVAAAASDPTWVKKAQAELDRVCGYAERLPSFEDRKNMPYMNAVVKEIFRWRPFTDLGAPHMLMRDDTYEGYRFPANTIFAINCWSIDVGEHPDGFRFWPERWLDPSIEGNNSQEDGIKNAIDDPLMGHWSYGAGRRVCVGYHVGDTNVWIATARMLYCFDFAENENNRIDTLNLDVEGHQKLPFEARLTPRSDQHRMLIEKLGKEINGAK